MKKILIILTIFITFSFSQEIIVNNQYVSSNPELCPSTFQISDGTTFGNKEYVGYSSVSSSTNGMTRYNQINNNPRIIRCWESAMNWHGLSGSYSGYYNYTVIPTCVPEIVLNTLDDGWVEVAKGISDSTSYIANFKLAHPDVQNMEAQPGDTCGNNSYINAENPCNEGYTLLPDGTTYSDAELGHYSCQVDPDAECVNGYSKDDNGLCEPDIDCPIPPMIYKFTSVDWGLDTRSCSPDSNLSEEQCNTNGYIYAKYLDEDPNDDLSSYASIFGDGCITSDYANKIISDHNWHTLVSGLLPTMGTSAGLLAQDLNRLFTSGKNLYNNIISAFKNSPLDDVKLLTYKPKVTEMQMAEDGIFYEVEAIAMNGDDVVKTTPNQTAYNQYLKDNGYISAVDDVPVGVENIEFPSVVSDIDDLFYRGADTTDFTNTMLGTANMSKNGKVPNLSDLDDVLPNKQVETTISINSKLKGTEVKNYPATLIKTAEKNLADRVETSYKGIVKYPDGSKTDLVISRTKYLDDGRVIDDVTTTYDVPTTSGVKTFGTNYQSFKNGAGEVTNIINSPSTITTTTTAGSTTTTNISSDALTTNTTQNAIDLSPVVNKLNSIDDQLRALINTEVPTELTDASVQLGHFNTALADFDVGFNSYKDFIDGIQNNFADLTSEFDNTRALLENKPQINEINGQCGFEFDYHGKTITADPCAFVLPYRPLLSLIFTLLGTFVVLGFSVKYLVSRNI